MAGTEIYYFSATGNSMAVARELAQDMNARLRPVAAVAEQDGIEFTADVIGFVFPIYDFKPPKIFEEVIAKASGLAGKYIFAVCTYGLVPLGSLRRFRRMLEAAGGELAAGFAVCMPHNGIGGKGISTRQAGRMYRQWHKKRPEVCVYVQSRKGGRLEASSPLLMCVHPRVLKLMPSALKFLYLLLTKGTGTLAFKVSEACQGCGTCARVCPRHNIEIVGQRPAWKDHCENCHACVNWCPREAISIGGHELHTRAYHHPAVSLREIVGQATAR